ncbi:unnamed protein product [Sordaria macrospora k-hell]|uniref:WGS project CABT00000000 data, contig 2.44 n=1 Tax=Sordaria macrospora (strain ATCC MYA-333 / DSM 997 / K(L3346) / K-hell) TaxID=771870 RepID=F7W8F6_SORMK|nr:uncharacterized protein SMAC_07311 [Sordaria macrospora k-hell]CCC13801.1 unnamed protein product [Sordaria macrospora k-hell]
MAISSLRRALLLAAAAALPFSQLVAGQTIQTEEGVVLGQRKTVAPAVEVVTADSNAPEAFVLTDDVIANLTDLNLSNITLFAFPEENGTSEVQKRTLFAGSGCKTAPGDFLWPNRLTWKVFDLLTGGALIETVPIGAVCYPNSGVYNAAKCQNILANWTSSDLHSSDPTSIMSPMFQGETCMPQNGNSSTCTVGGFPVYAVKATNVAQIQLAINFARNLNLRLVVKNTGHDFLGKSTGYGALSIWTHNLKKLEYVKSIKTPSYTGPAFKIGAGIQVHELYEAAKKYGVTAIGGDCHSVGVAGGFTAGGGHSPMSSIAGLGSDQVLSIDVVLPNGRFVTADETHHTDLFWALRGGGGATFGVVTGMTVKVWPKTNVSGMTFTVVSGNGSALANDVFWEGMYAYWRHFPEYAKVGTQGYSQIFPSGTGGFIFLMVPFWVPGMKLADFKTLVQPLLDEWTAIGFNAGFVDGPKFFEYDNYYDAWIANFPLEAVGTTSIRTASRLFPAKNWEDEETLTGMMNAVRSVIEDGSVIIQYNFQVKAPAGTPDSAANSHWRDALWFGIFGAGWDPSLDAAGVEAINRKITEDWMGRLRVYGAGGYLNEGDVMEPGFGEAYFGSNYERLQKIKKEVDPTGLFWAPTAVGSEEWEVQGQEEWLTLQTGKLCRKAAC